MTRQELIRLQRTIGFSQSLLQYLGTFSRETTGQRPIGHSLTVQLPARWDMNNLQLVIPDSWIVPGNHGQGHAYGKQRHTDIGELFGLMWVAGNFDTRVLASLIPTITVIGNISTTLNPLPAQPGLFPDHRLCHELGEWWRYCRSQSRA